MRRSAHQSAYVKSMRGQRCTADPGPTFLVASWVPDLRRVISCRAASGTREDTTPHSRGANSSGLCQCHPRNRGCRECRVHERTHCLTCKTKTRTQANTGTPKSRRHSLRNGFTAYSALSPETGLFCLRRPSIISMSLIPASGDQDHTPLPSASARLISRAYASTAARTTCRDDRDTPSVAGAGWDGYAPVFRFSERGLFLRRGLDIQRYF
jgi:hypothetical protein